MQNMISTTINIKLCLVGEAGVGKTCIARRYVEGTFEPNEVETIGANFNPKNVMIDNNQYSIGIWDTAGQEAYRSLIPSYYRDAGIVIIVYSVIDRYSFNALKDWIDEVRKRSDAAIVLCGNKCDLESQRQVPFDEALRLADEEKLEVFETSALSSAGIDELFSQALISYSLKQEIQVKTQAKLNLQEAKASGCNC